MTNQVQTPPSFPSGVYDVLKYIALVVLPALGTLYFALSMIWKFPAGEEVVGTIAALDAFLGILLNRSSKNFKENVVASYMKNDAVGTFVVLQDREGAVEGMRFEALQDPLILPDQKNVICNVRREQSIN